MELVRTLIEQWPSAEIFSDDLGLKYRSHGRVMKLRGRIPQAYWDMVVGAARARGIKGVTVDYLRSIHASAVKKAS